MRGGPERGPDGRPRGRESRLPVVAKNELKEIKEEPETGSPSEEGVPAKRTRHLAPLYGPNAHTLKYTKNNNSAAKGQLPNSPQVVGNSKTENAVPESCPIYFGIKSYIHDFYYPPDVQLLNSGEFVQDDFEFVIEPGKRRWKNCWFRVGLWGGINLLLLGIIALLVGHLTPPRETVVARLDNLEILDRWAIAFNSRLHLCRLAGIVMFCVGGIVLMLTLLISIYRQERSTFYVVDAAGIPTRDAFARNAGQTAACLYGSRIPLSSTLKTVQPTAGR